LLLFENLLLRQKCWPRGVKRVEDIIMYMLNFQMAVNVSIQ